MGVTAYRGSPAITPGLPNDHFFLTAPARAARGVPNGPGLAWNSAVRPWRALGHPLFLPRGLFVYSQRELDDPLGDAVIDDHYEAVLDPGGWAAARVPPHSGVDPFLVMAAADGIDSFEGDGSFGDIALVIVMDYTLFTQPDDFDPQYLYVPYVFTGFGGELAINAEDGCSAFVAPDGYEPDGGTATDISYKGDVSCVTDPETGSGYTTGIALLGVAKYKRIDTGPARSSDTAAAAIARYASSHILVVGRKLPAMTLTTTSGDQQFPFDDIDLQAHAAESLGIDVTAFEYQEVDFRGLTDGSPEWEAADASVDAIVSDWIAANLTL